MQSLWSVQSKFEHWLKVELAMLKARVAKGQLSPLAFSAISGNARIDVSRIKELDKIYRHDLIAFVEAVQETLVQAGAGEYKEEFHKYLTSYDTEDPAAVLMLRSAVSLILEQLDGLYKALVEKAFEHKETLMIARTHGQYAEPDSFGRLLLVFASAVLRSINRLRLLLETELSEAKMSGAVGVYGGTDPKLEVLALRELGLRPALAETQILQRDRHAAVLNALAVAAGSIEQMARTFWEMMRSEVRELREPRSKHQRGSSAMAHKKNPILTEQFMGLPRLLRAYAQAAMENIPTPEGRDISQSSVERHIFPDATSLLHYLAHKTTSLVKDLEVLPRRMFYHLNEDSRGVWASQRVRNLLMEAGVGYSEAYTYVQGVCFVSEESERHLSAVLATLTLSRTDSRTGAAIVGRRLEGCFDAWAYIRAGVEYVFKQFEQ
jgi:adenylosuccinate lyase